MRKKNTEDGTGSVRRDRTTMKALEMGLGVGAWPLDCYNNKVATDGVCFTVTTRVSACNNYFILEICDEEDYPDKCNG